MSGLLGADGNPISSSQFKKAKPPATGEAFHPWMQGEMQYLTLPGGGVVGMNLDNLTLEDFRLMKDHHQVNASLSVLAFMLHQIDWKIEVDGKSTGKIVEHCEQNIDDIWTPLVRALSNAFWCGYSPNILQWENDKLTESLQLTKVKDIDPLISRVKWKMVDGWAPPGRTAPKIPIYDGIRVLGTSWPVPTENTLWYPLLMEHNNYYGRKMLRPAFTPWYFSILMHLFTNRYFERFGEPLPVGRAPYEEELAIGDTTVNSRQAMLEILQQLRNRGVVVLPSDRTEVGSSGQSEYDYGIEYLESQMRGADFDRYITRLDEEISLAMFTPLLVLRTADVGSYNLGVGHMSTYLNMLNAIAGDWGRYINKYILSPMVNYNFSKSAPRAKIVFRKLGRDNAETMRAVMSAIISGKMAKPDLEELGTIVGLTLTEIKQVTTPDPANPEDLGTADPNNPKPKAAPAPPKSAGTPPAKKAAAGRDISEAFRTAEDIKIRIGQQVVSAYSKNKFNDSFAPTMGYRRRFEESLKAGGFGDESYSVSTRVYTVMDGWLTDMIGLGIKEFDAPEKFMSIFSKTLDRQISELADA